MYRCIISQTVRPSEGGGGGVGEGGGGGLGRRGRLLVSIEPMFEQSIAKHSKQCARNIKH